MKAIVAKSVISGLFNEAIKRILVLGDGGYLLCTFLYGIRTVHYATSSKVLCKDLAFT